MNRFHVLIVVLNLFGLVGCISHPQTAEEFRKAVPGAFSATVETFEVDRPFGQSGEHVPKDGAELFVENDQDDVANHDELSSHRDDLQTHGVGEGKKAELHVQQHHEQGRGQCQQGA